MLPVHPSPTQWWIVAFSPSSTQLMDCCLLTLANSAYGLLPSHPRQLSWRIVAFSPSPTQLMDCCLLTLANSADGLLPSHPRQLSWWIVAFSPSLTQLMDCCLLILVKSADCYFAISPSVKGEAKSRSGSYPNLRLGPHNKGLIKLKGNWMSSLIEKV